MWPKSATRFGKQSPKWDKFAKNYQSHQKWALMTQAWIMIKSSGYISIHLKETVDFPH